MTNPNTLATPDQLTAPSSVIDTRAFTIANVNTLRELVQTMPQQDGESSDDFLVRQNHEVTDYIATTGLATDADTYAATYDRMCDLVHIPDNEWYVGPRVYQKDIFGNQVLDDEGNPIYDNAPSGQEKVWVLQTELFGSIVAETDTTSDTPDVANAPDGQVAETLESMKSSLEGKRELLAELAAKRQGRIFGKGGEAYAEAKAQYDQEMIALAKLELQDQLEADTLSLDDKKALAAVYVVEDQAKLRNLTIEKLKGTKVGRFVEFMNKGNVAVRIAKGFGLGAIAGVVAGGVGVVAGAASIAVAAGGVSAAVIGLTRFARGFARGDAHGGRGMNTLDKDAYEASLKAEMGDDHSQYIDVAAAQLSSAFEADTKQEQAKRRKSVGAGLAGIAIGAVAAEGIHLIVEASALNGWGDRLFTPHAGATQGPGSHDITPPSGGSTGGQSDLIPPSSGGTPPEVNGHGAWPGASGIDTVLNGTGGMTEMTPAGLEQFEQWANGRAVMPGDTIWGLSTDYLHAQGVANPDVFQIDAVKDAVLKDLLSRGLADNNGWLQAGDILRLA